LDQKANKPLKILFKGGENLMEFIINPNGASAIGGDCTTYKACPNVGICGTKQHCTEVYYIVAGCPTKAAGCPANTTD
jgi:hypothetical protein